MKPADLAIGQPLTDEITVVDTYAPNAPGDYFEIDVLVRGRTAALDNAVIGQLAGAVDVQCLSAVGDHYRLFFDPDADVEVQR